MQTSVFLAKLLGPMFLLAGVASFSRREAFRVILREFIASPALMYLAAFFGLLGGLALLLTHNVWTPDWRVLITLLGWITLVRALITMFWPQALVWAARGILARPNVFVVATALDILIGAVLSHFGYFA